jgi:predicted small lipoprotein YifL
MKVSLFKVLLGVAVLAILGGCYPKGPVYYSDSDLIATNFDSGYNFSSDSTYAMPDEVAHIVDENGNDPDIDRAYDQNILDAIEENMTARGYTRVEDPFDADLIIKPAVWSATSTGVIYDYGFYWGGYYPWVGVPFYPWGGYVYSYTYGTLLFDIIDVAGIVPEDEFIPIVWSGVLNGALSDNNVDTRERIENGISQCFEQSPYLTAAE